MSAASSSNSVPSQSISPIANDPTGENLEKILNLQEIQSQQDLGSPNVSQPLLARVYQLKLLKPSAFSFSTEQETLIRDLFAEWGGNFQNEEMCLLDLFGIAAFDLIEEIAGKAEGSSLQSKLCEHLTYTYLCLRRIYNQKELKQPFSHWEAMFGAAPKKIISALSRDVQEPLRKILLAKQSKITTSKLKAESQRDLLQHLKKNFEKFKEVLSLLFFSLNNKNSPPVLISRNILWSACSDRSGQPHRNIRNFKQYSSYAITVCDQLLKMFPLKVPPHLAAFSNSLGKNEWKSLVKPLENLVCAVDPYLAGTKETLQKQLEGQTGNIELNATAIFSCELLQIFATHLRDILEKKILPIQLPGYISRENLGRRLMLNLFLLKTHFSQSREEDPLQKELVSILRGPFWEEVKAFLSFPPVTNVLSWFETQRQNNIETKLIFKSQELELYRPFLKTFEKNLAAFDRNALYARLEPLLITLPANERTPEHLQKVALDTMVEVCRFAMLLYDVHALLEEPGDDEFPPALADLVSLEGIEETLERVEERVEEQLAAQTAASPKPAKKERRKKEEIEPYPLLPRPPVSSSSSSSSSNTVKFRSRNIDRVLEELKREYGFVLDHTTGGHEIWKNTETGGIVPIPTSKAELKPGTLKSIEKIASTALP
jgi:predicted RNA binding protein YcfA (HicA-like mRNA interferase family)